MAAIMYKSEKITEDMAISGVARVGIHRFAISECSIGILVEFRLEFSHGLHELLALALDQI